MSMEIGTFIWSCTDSKYWPGLSEVITLASESPGGGQEEGDAALFTEGVVVAGEDAGLNPLPACSVHVYWFGDNRLSTVPITKSIPFAAGFHQIYNAQQARMGQKWNAGVLEAIVEYSNLNENTEYQDAITFAMNSYGDVDHVGVIKVPCKVTVELKKRLLGPWIHYNTIKKHYIFRQYISEGRNIAELCLACYSQSTACDHPYFEGKLCHDCNKKLQYTLNTIYKNSYCVICGNDSYISSCDHQKCLKSFCGHCIKNFLDKLKPAKWLCFICNPKQTQVISLRSNYLKTVIEFIAPDISFKQFPRINIGRRNTMILFHGKSEVIPILCPSDDFLCIINSNEELCGFAAVKTTFFLYSKAYFINYSIGSYAWISPMEQKSIDSWKLSNTEMIDVLIGGTSHIILEDKEKVEEEDFQAKQFWEFTRILYTTRKHNLKMNADLKFVFEINPEVKKSFVDVVTRYLDVMPFCIQTSAGEYRMIWTNIDI